MSEVKPMTFADVVWCAAEGVPVWEEIHFIEGHFAPEDPERQLAYCNAEDNYGKTWRDWRYKPTAEQAAAVPWGSELCKKR